MCWIFLGHGPSMYILSMDISYLIASLQAHGPSMYILSMDISYLTASLQAHGTEAHSAKGRGELYCTSR